MSTGVDLNAVRDRDSEAAPSAAMPRAIKIGAALFVTMIVAAAVGLFVARGNALLVDLYGLTGFGFCL